MKNFYIVFGIGPLLLAEVCSRIFRGCPRKVVCRPFFFVPMTFTHGMVVTLIETIAATLLLYQGVIILTQN